MKPARQLLCRPVLHRQPHRLRQSAPGGILRSDVTAADFNIAFVIDADNGTGDRKGFGRPTLPARLWCYHAIA
jgi:hypothetical protein